MIGNLTLEEEKNFFGATTSVVEDTGAMPDDCRDGVTKDEEIISQEIVCCDDSGIKNSTSSPEEYSKTYFSENVISSTPLDVIPSQYKKLDFPDPISMLAFYDQAIREDQVTLCKWQVDIGEELGAARPTTKEPLKYVVCAANGSGKDCYVIAPFAVWFILCKIRSRAIITSSSGVQLSSQTENYIRNYCQTINNWHKKHEGKEVFKINQRYIRCYLTGSEIRMFATDEAGKAEGYHPFPDYPNAEMAIITTEAKSISEDIFQALTRCTGFNYWLEVSTPGEPKGHFYRAFTQWKHKKHITAFDCPYLGSSHIEDAAAEYGVHSAFYRSMILALFTSLGGSVVITQEAINDCITAAVKIVYQDWPIRVGIDLAAGGDETVMIRARGNAVLDIYAFHEDKAPATARIIEAKLNEWGLPKNHGYIFADDGGIGKSIIDILNEAGWSINRVLNNARAFNHKAYANRGYEMWYKMKRFIEEKYIVLPAHDEKLIEQLANRKYSTNGSNGRPLLQKKQDARGEGFKSPDRADALVLAFSDLSVNDFAEIGSAKVYIAKPNITQDDVVKYMDNVRYSGGSLTVGNHGNVEELLFNSGFSEFYNGDSNQQQKSKRRYNGCLDAIIEI